MHIRIGTRGSALALAQANEVKTKLQQTYPEDTVDIIVIKTKGDRIQHRPLDKIGDKGIFVKEIEQQILDSSIDIGVHSMKDMPSQLPKGLLFAKTWQKEDARDVLVLKEAASFAELPVNAVLATGSKRRRLQIQALRPDIKVINIRGNVETRLQKMYQSDIDGLIMAAAGFHRLGLTHLISEYLSVEEVVPACAQGAIALEISADNAVLKDKLDALHDPESFLCASAERNFLQQVNGSCHIPVGAYCEKQQDGYRMMAMLGNEHDDIYYKETMCGADPLSIAAALADELLKKVHHE